MEEPQEKRASNPAAGAEGEKRPSAAGAEGEKRPSNPEAKRPSEGGKRPSNAGDAPPPAPEAPRASQAEGKAPSNPELKPEASQPVVKQPSADKPPSNPAVTPEQGPPSAEGQQQPRKSSQPRRVSIPDGNLPTVKNDEEEEDEEEGEDEEEEMEGAQTQPMPSTQNIQRLSQQGRKTSTQKQRSDNYQNPYSSIGIGMQPSNPLHDQEEEDDEEEEYDEEEEMEIPESDHLPAGVDMTIYGYQRRDLEKFCSEQIRIPPKLPNILKQFTKAAMRTQPRDLLHWSAAYFRALADGEVPPAKETLEYPQIESKDGLTVGYMRVLNKQLGGRDLKEFSKLKLKLETIRAKWVALCLDGRAFDDMMTAARLDEKEETEWKKVVGILSGSLGKNLTDTMRIVCEVLTEQPEGVDAMIPFVHFWEIYIFLAKLDGCITNKQLTAVNEFLMARSQPNFCLIGPRDFLDPKCPPLY